MLLHTYKQSQIQRPLTTAHLAQTMTLLQLTGNELRQKIESELATNPALETFDSRVCPTCRRKLIGNASCPVCTRTNDGTSEEPIIFISPSTDFVFPASSYSHEEIITEEIHAEIDNLPKYIFRQIAPELTSNDRPIATHILNCLDEDGLLTVPIIEIAQYHHVRIGHVEDIIHLIQRANPIGAGSSTPREALLVQLRTLAETHEIPKLAPRIIEDGLGLLSKHAYNELSKQLGSSVDKVTEAVKFITDNLNPYPARAHWGNVHNDSNNSISYLQPDIIISFTKSSNKKRLIVEIIAPYTGYIRINPLFKKAILQAPEEKSAQWQSDLDQAILLIKCLQQRNNTIVRLMQHIIKLQRGYILHGDTYLKPMTRAAIAEKLGVHESTMSRAVSGKTIQLPNKHIIPLATMFDSSLPVRARIRSIIEKEKKPLSDSQISSRLAEQGISVARRTVAKYRSMEGILPARLRKNLVASLPNLINENAAI